MEDVLRMNDVPSEDAPCTIGALLLRMCGAALVKRTIFWNKYPFKF